MDPADGLGPTAEVEPAVAARALVAGALVVAALTEVVATVEASQVKEGVVVMAPAKVAVADKGSAAAAKGRASPGMEAASVAWRVLARAVALVSVKARAVRAVEAVVKALEEAAMVGVEAVGGHSVG